MKLKLKLLVLLFAGTAIVYTACKKSSTKPSDPTLTPDVVAGQMATNIYQSLFGGLGAFDVSNGLNAPSALGVVHATGPGGGFSVPSNFRQPLNAKMNGNFSSNIACGLAIDTTVSLSDTSNGTAITFAGSLKFNYVCTNSEVSGFTTNDNLTITLANSSLNFSYKVGEILTLTSLDPTDPNANISVGGSLNSNGSYQYKTGTKASGTSVFNYTLASLVISPTLGDVVSGTATFNTSGTGPKGVWNYQGTIVFLGNHFATVTINGKAYHVNLQTGAVG